MSGKVVDRLPHSCGASRALNVFENEDGSYSGYCFSCKKVVKDPYGDKPEGYKPEPIQKRSPEQIARELAALGNFPTRELKDRGISAATCEVFGVKVGLSEENGYDITSHYYPYYKNGVLKGYKVRLTEEKEFFGVGETRDVEPFGWKQAIANCANNPKIIITEGECFLGETEVLTNSGWKRFDNLNGSEKVAQLQPDVGTMEFVEPVAYIKKDAPKGLVKSSVKGYEVLTTGGHNMAYIDSKGSWIKQPANTKPKSNWKIPRVGYLNGGGIPLAVNEIALTLAICADAKIDVRKSGKLYIHFGFKKERKVKRLLGILDSLQITPTVNSNNGYTYISFTAPDFIKGKRIPDSWVTDASLDQRHFILEEMVHWDGNSVNGRNQTEFSSKHKEEADKIQLIAHTCGKVSTVMRRENSYGVWYKVSILHNKQTNSCQQLKQEVVYNQDAHVYCVTVPTGYIMVRHNDKVSVIGNCDAMAVYQALLEEGDRPPSVISVQSGASSISKLAPYVSIMKKKFRDIVLCFDQDDAGKNAVKEFTKICPDVLVADLPLKDANDMLKEGRNLELKKALLWDAVPPTSGKSIRSSDIWELAEYIPEDGVDWPWPSVTEKTRGIRRGETYYFGAGQKMGKSVVVNELAVNLIKQVDTPIFLVKPEEGMGGTLKRLAGTAVDQIFYDPRIQYTQEQWEEGKRLVGGRAILYDTYQDVKWEDVKQEIRYNVTVLGCKDVFLDPLTCFTVGVSSGEANDILVKIASEFAGLAKELDFTGYVFCHLNNPSSGTEHNRGGKVLSSQFAGSRAMARFCHLMIGLEGNKDPELPEEVRNTRRFVFLEDRNFGESGYVDLFFNKNTGRLLELHQHKEEDL